MAGRQRELDKLKSKIMGKRKIETSSHDKAKVSKRGFQERDFVWIQIPGMKMMWPAQVVQLSGKHVVAYVKSDDDNFHMKMSESSMMPFMEHCNVLKAEGIEYLKRQRNNLKAFLKDVTWATNESLCADKNQEEGNHDLLDHDCQPSENTQSVQKAKHVRVEGTSTENKSSDGETSDVYPALTVQAPVVVDTDDDDDDAGTDDDLDKDSIVRDVKNPNIHITKDDSCIHKSSDSDSSTSNKTPRTLIKKKKPKQKMIINDHKNQEEGNHDSLDHDNQPSEYTQSVQKAKHVRVEGTSTENKSTDGETSDVYPALTVQAPVVVGTDDDAGTDDDLDEDSIVGDVKNPNICITKDDSCIHKSSDSDSSTSYKTPRTLIKKKKPKQKMIINDHKNQEEGNHDSLDHDSQPSEYTQSVQKAKHVRVEGTSTENKSTDGETSDVYPALTVQAPVVVDTDDDAGTDDDLDEDSIVGDVKNPNICFTKDDSCFHKSSDSDSSTSYKTPRTRIKKKKPKQKMVNDSCIHSSDTIDTCSEIDEIDCSDADKTYEPHIDNNSSDSDSSTSNKTPRTPIKKKKPRQKMVFNDHKNQEDHDSQSSDYIQSVQKAKHVRVEGTSTENNSSDGEMSDVYPALTLQAPDVIDTDDDAGTDDDLDEDSIVRDVKNPNIYITKVITSSTRKNGKAKKNPRVYNSYQYCSMCKKKVSNLSQHLLRNRQVHDANENIKEIREETDQKTKKKLQTLLRGKFNHDFNMITIKKGKGEILLERRPTKEFRLQDYGPCPNCFLWFAKALLKKHASKCPNKKTDNSTIGDLTTQSECISGQLTGVASKQLVNEVFSKMRRDQISEVVKGDLLITQLGNQWLEKNVGNVLKRGVYTSQILRLIGRFLIILRRLKPLQEGVQSTLWDYLKPPHFDVIVKACILTASPIEEEDDLKAPSNAIKIGYDLKRILSGKIGLSIIHDRPADAEDAEKMLKLMDIYWGTKVTKAARVILLERSYYAKKNLPLPADIQRLTMFLRKKLLDFDYTEVNRHNHRQIAEAVQAKLVIYNRRRTGEMQAARLRDYDRRCSGIDGEHLVGSCSELEKKLLESQEVMTIRGKVGRAVPVILPDEVMEGLRYLTDSSVRSQVGISPSNRYLFASEGESIVWAYDSVRKAAEAASLEKPEAVTSTSLRKYMATVTQVLDLKESQMQWVVNHLGHTMDVHKLHYRATSDILERTQIAKILLLQDQGRIGQFKNRGLEEISLNDIVFQEQQQIPSTGVLDEPVPEVTAIDFVSPDVINETLHEAETFFGETVSKPRKRPVTTTKTSWTEEEEEEVRIRFKRFFDKKIRPKPADCMKVIAKSKNENGLLGNRRKDVLKKKVFRMIDKLQNDR